MGKIKLGSELRLSFTCKFKISKRCKRILICFYRRLLFFFFVIIVVLVLLLPYKHELGAKKWAHKERMEVQTARNSRTLFQVGMKQRPTSLASNDTILITNSDEAAAVIQETADSSQMSSQPNISQDSQLSAELSQSDSGMLFLFIVT